MEENSLKPGYRLLVVGGSAGSLDVILTFIPKLRTDLPFAIVLVLHRKSNASSVLIDLLAAKTPLPVKEAEEKEPLQAGKIYLAPPDYHLLVEKDFTVSLDDSEKVHHSRPSIDVTFETAAEAYGPALACLLLSGANADGAEGIRCAKQLKGLTLVQDPRTAEVSYMPQQAIETQSVDKVVSVLQMHEVINSLADARQ
jgi:two-component system chemotaxis response regulator CheB